MQASSSEKHNVVFGPECGLENEVKHSIIVHALYRGKSAGANYWQHALIDMKWMGFSSFKADPNAWPRPALKYDGVEKYQHVLLYTDDILAIMEKSECFLHEELGKTIHFERGTYLIPNKKWSTSTQHKLI